MSALPEEAAFGDTATLAPAWLREVETAVVTNSQILIYGNVRDHFLIPNGRRGWRFQDIQESLWWCLSRIGYPVMVQADVMDGIRPARRADGEEAAKRLLGEDLDGRRSPAWRSCSG